MPTISIPQVFKDCSQTLLHAIFGVFHFVFYWMWWNWGTGLAGTSRGNSVESIHDYYCFDCQAGRFDPVDSTAFVNVGCTLLYSEITHSLVTGNRAIGVNISDVVISVGLFLFFCKSLISASTSPVCRSWHFQVFRQWQECLCRQMLKSAWVPFPLPGLWYTWE